MILTFSLQMQLPLFFCHFGNGGGYECADFGTVWVAVGLDLGAVGPVLVGPYGGLLAYVFRCTIEPQIRFIMSV